MFVLCVHIYVSVAHCSYHSVAVHLGECFPTVPFSYPSMASSFHVMVCVRKRSHSDLLGL